MRFIAYANGAEPAVGAVVDGDVVPVASLSEFYADAQLIGSVAPVGDPIPRSALDEVPPVPPTSRILCVGLNYLDHIAETGRQRPEAPNIFGRWYTTLVCQDATIPVPPGESGLDWEGELAVIVGRELIDVDADEAMTGVLGYTCFNDVSARAYQRRTPQWALGKNADRSGPIGPVVVTADEYGDPYPRKLTTRYNGTVVQSTTTDMMIFRIGEILSYASKCMTLQPGDVIATGTPSGVGSKMNPPVIMTPGDSVEVEIEGIGVLRSQIV